MQINNKILKIAFTLSFILEVEGTEIVDYIENFTNDKPCISQVSNEITSDDSIINPSCTKQEQIFHFFFKNNFINVNTHINSLAGDVDKYHSLLLRYENSELKDALFVQFCNANTVPKLENSFVKIDWWDTSTCKVESYISSFEELSWKCVITAIVNKHVKITQKKQFVIKEEKNFFNNFYATNDYKKGFLTKISRIIAIPNNQGNFSLFVAYDNEEELNKAKIILDNLSYNVETPKKNKICNIF